ncbi:hypothetical protein TTHERM_000395809 (macronuclear) [Tetrahymena thermophila SB210]|uniref:Uncharacterized protein n=1 Tax=Tetrahymena thermophila (strain SB210) TaxID=312017 RepID=W7XL11_TETTS|nr:hypothetical protein TTHERM_000395809 [Tetrahymena thermophila SB210]EWS75479.1 hypothetical protein TTHERM_000395809 [Tetrahymena thermophila SB210]|eukprot:XP_012651948.1 hypothetical protein TTHERM_000395809 [Tetrahymena thermophila SB210]
MIYYLPLSKFFQQYLIIIFIQNKSKLTYQLTFNILQFIIFHKLLFKIFDKINKQMQQENQYFDNVEEFLNSSLQFHQVLHIDLSSNQIGDEGASALGSALANCTNLSKLVLILNNNIIGGQGASVLGSGLVNCTNLSNLGLHLYNNKIGDKGVLGLSELAKCTNLSNLILDLSNNQIGGKGVSELGSALQN